MTPCRHNPPSKMKAPLQLYTSMHHDVKRGRTIFPIAPPVDPTPIAIVRLSVKRWLMTILPDIIRREAPQPTTYTNI